MSESYLTIIVLTFVGFVALAAILLVPVYLFLKKEERASEGWTEESLRHQAQAADALQENEPAAPTGLSVASGGAASNDSGIEAGSSSTRPREASGRS